MVKLGMLIHKNIHFNEDLSISFVENPDGQYTKKANLLRFKEGYGHYHPSPDDFDVIAEDLWTKECLGTIQMQENEEGIWLSWVEVAESAWGKGVADKMMQVVI